MGNKKKQEKKAEVKTSKNMIFIILVIVLAAFAVYTAMNSNQKQGASSAENTQSAEVVKDVDLKILKSGISEKAEFYPYQAGDTYMEVLAVKASDGSIRTALNTCQVCFDSGRGYYKQEGNTLVCQNCGNVFGVNDVEVVRGGCNPVPVLQENKTDDGEYITISKEFLAESKDLFADWKR